MPNKTKKTQIQDDVREDMLKKIFSLKDSGEGRMGADAIDDKKRRYELKSGSKKMVTTARDVGLHTIKKWREKHWLVGFGKVKQNKFLFDEIFYLSPNDMEPFYQKIENKIQPDLDLLEEIKINLSKKMDQTKLERLEYLILRGYTLNNPKIPYSYIVDNGHLLKKWNSKELEAAIGLRTK